MLFKRNIKKIENDFLALIKKIQDIGNLIQKKQKEKLHLLDFLQQKKSLYENKKISKISYFFSKRKAKKILKKLDNEISFLIEKIRILSIQAKKFSPKKELKIISQEAKKLKKLKKHLKLKKKK